MLNKALTISWPGRHAEKTRGYNAGCIVYRDGDSPQYFRRVNDAMKFYGCKSIDNRQDHTYETLPTIAFGAKLKKLWAHILERRGFTSARCFRTDCDGLVPLWRVAAMDSAGHEVRGCFYPCGGADAVAEMEMIRKPREGWPIRLRDL